jgi:UPF0271 protein
MGLIELNADVGEGCDDAGLMPYLDRASIACGGHAGDAASMAAALRLAASHGVAAGAHPGYPDRTNFGRQPLPATPAVIRAWVIEQIEALAEQAQRLGLHLAHVKPHGALYNVAARDPATAQAITGAIAAVDRRLILIGLSGSRLIEAGRAMGLDVLNEAFADRRYRAVDALVSRETPGAVIHDPVAAAEQAVTLAGGLGVRSPEGVRLAVAADTLCLHSDTPRAVEIARAVHAVLRAR